MATSLIEREYYPLPDPESPKWWELREQAREGLRSAEVPDYRIDQILGKNTKDFEKMNRLRQEAGMKPVEGMLESIPYRLGSADAALGLTSLPAFTKTMGSMALPYAAMMGESALGFTDALKGLKEFPEDAPKDWKYRLAQAALPLTAVSGLMGASRFLPKGSGKTMPTGVVDKTRRNILKGAAAVSGIATLPAALKVGLKGIPTAAKLTPVAAKGFMALFGNNLSKSHIGSRINQSIDYYFKPYVINPKDGLKHLSVDKEIEIDKLFGITPDAAKTYDKSNPVLQLFKPQGQLTDALRQERMRTVFIDEDYNLTKTFKDIEKTAETQNPLANTIERTLADDLVILDTRMLAQTGKDHFKNYGLKPGELQILDGESFDHGYLKATTIKNTDPALVEVRPGLFEITDYIAAKGKKIGESENISYGRGYPEESGSVIGEVWDIEYFELDGVPVMLGNMGDGSGFSTEIMVIPNQAGMKRLMEVSELPEVAPFTFPYGEGMPRRIAFQDTLMGVTKKAEGGPIDRIAEIELEGV